MDAFVRRCLSCDEGDQYAEAHRRLDRVLLTRILEATGGDQHDAARRLGISPESLGRRLRELGPHPSRGIEVGDEREQTDLPHRSLADIEWEHIQRVLSATNQNREEAAKILGIGEATLYRRLRSVRTSNCRDLACNSPLLSKWEGRCRFESRKHHFETLHRLPNIDAVLADLAHPLACSLSHPRLLL